MTTDRTRKATPQGSRKPTGKKAPAKRTSAKKTTTTADGGEPSTRNRASAPRAESRPRPSAAEIAKFAVKQLADLSGKAAEGVTGVERTDDGWRVRAEVLELRRIPETTDVLSQYEIETDEKGNLVGYRRVRRYTRGSAQED